MLMMTTGKARNGTGDEMRWWTDMPENIVFGSWSLGRREPWVC